MSELKIVAIDGPVAVRKSIIGSLLVERLGYRRFDKGAMFRAWNGFCPR